MPTHVPTLETRREKMPRTAAVTGHKGFVCWPTVGLPAAHTGKYSNVSWPGGDAKGSVRQSQAVT